MDLKTKLENRIARLSKEITSKKAALERAQVDLENLAFTEKRLSKQREKRISKAGAARTTPEESTVLNEVVNEVAPAAAAPEKKSWSLF